jgi:hypothetical protein
MLELSLLNKNVIIKVLTVKNERHIYRLKNEPRSCNPHEDLDQQARLIEYDDWMRHEEKKYSRLLTELNKARWLAQSQLSEDIAPDCGMDQIMNESLSSEMEATRLTDDEIRHGCGLTMEEALLRYKKSSALNINGSLDKTITQYSISFHVTLSLSRDMCEPCISEPLLWNSISVPMYCNWNEENDHTHIILKYKNG